MTEVYLGDHLYQFPSDDLSELSDHTDLYTEERWENNVFFMEKTTTWQQRWDELQSEMKKQGYLRIKGLNRREDVLSARRGVVTIQNKKIIE